MPAYSLPEMSPWRRRPLTIPPSSWRDWSRLALWELWMGMLLFGALRSGIELLITAPRHSGAGPLNVVFLFWCGLLLVAAGLWLLWELWNGVAPKPVTDDFLKLLDDSFGCDWRKPRTWPWKRLVRAYGFTLLGAATAQAIWILT